MTIRTIVVLFCLCLAAPAWAESHADAEAAPADADEVAATDDAEPEPDADGDEADSGADESEAEASSDELEAESSAGSKPASKPQEPKVKIKRKLPTDRSLAPLDPDVVKAISTPALRSPSAESSYARKPWLATMGQTTLGGYADIHLRYERVDGLVDQLSFVPERFNFFTFTPVGDRVRITSELEIEEAGEEIKLELGTIDFEIDPAFTFRAGILLAPLGRFNVEHDSPQNAFTDRPLAVTEIIPSTLSEVGMGFYGAVHPTAGSQVTYEIYAVNGLSEVVAQDAQTRISAGKDNFEDNNPSPSVTGRVGISPVPGLELGLSGHFGPYNAYKLGGERVEKTRTLGLYALDLRVDRGRFSWQTELAWASIDVPPEAGGLYASSQWGAYTQLVVRFLRDTLLPGSSFAAGLRYGFVDFDTDSDGDQVHRVTAGLNFRPVEETVFKLDYQRTISEDPLANVEHSAAILFSVASYF